MDEREKLLTEERDSFISAVQKAIIDNGKISDSAKKSFRIFQDRIFQEETL